MLVLLDWLGSLTIAAAFGALAVAVRRSVHRSGIAIGAAPVHWIERNRLIAEARRRLLGTAVVGAVGLAYFSLALVGESSRVDSLTMVRVVIAGCLVLLGGALRRLDTAVLGVPDGLGRREAVLGWWIMRPAPVWVLASALFAPTVPSVRGFLPWLILLVALLVIQLRLEWVLDRLGLLVAAPELDQLADDVGAAGAAEVRTPVPEVFLLGSGRLAVTSAARSGLEPEQIHSAADEAVTWTMALRWPRLIVKLFTAVMTVLPGALLLSRDSFSDPALVLGTTFAAVAVVNVMVRRLSRGAAEEIERRRSGDDVASIAMAAERVCELSGRPATARSGRHRDLASHLRAAGRVPGWEMPRRPARGALVRGAVVGLGVGLLPWIFAIALVSLPGRTGQIAEVAFLADDGWQATELVVDLVDEGDISGADRVVALVDGESSDIAVRLVRELLSRGRCGLPISTSDLATSEDPPLVTALRVCGTGSF